MVKKKRASFNPKKEVSVMAWIEDDTGAVLLVRQAVGQNSGHCLEVKLSGTNLLSVP
jgi:hypothetical protein